MHNTFVVLVASGDCQMRRSARDLKSDVPPLIFCSFLSGDIYVLFDILDRSH